MALCVFALVSLAGIDIECNYQKRWILASTYFIPMPFINGDKFVAELKQVKTTGIGCSKKIDMLENHDEVSKYESMITRKHQTVDSRCCQSLVWFEPATSQPDRWSQISLTILDYIFYCPIRIPVDTVTMMSPNNEYWDESWWISYNLRIKSSLLINTVWTPYGTHA